MAHTSGKFVLALSGRPQFLPTWASPQAAGMSSLHDGWLPPKQVERDGGETHTHAYTHTHTEGEGERGRI